MKKTYLFLLAAMTLFAGCQEKDEIFEDPYAGGKEALGIKMDPNVPASPVGGLPGTEVTIRAAGLVPYKDQLEFAFNGTPAEVLEVSETQIKVKVPSFASTGVVSVSIGNQVFFGPKFTVRGKINIDPSFRAVAGTDGGINQVLPLVDGRYLILGNFTNYDNKGVVKKLNRIVMTTKDGDLDRSPRFGEAANGQLTSAVQASNKFVIAGGFSGFDEQTGKISNITRLNNNGTIDTMSVTTYTDSLIWVPVFNGGTDQGINELFLQGDKIIGVGNFRYHVSRIYDQPTYDLEADSIILDSVEMRQVVRFNMDGSLDKTYHFDDSKEMGFRAANGPVRDSYMDEEGRLILVGNFTTFDGEPAGSIVRLTADGKLDESFQAGSGTSEAISSITYNEQTEKYLITGNFRSYNGTAVSGMALLNKDGSLDASFQPGEIGGGYVYYAKQLSDGMIIASGGFQEYNKVRRNGFMILDKTGKLMEGYNSTGPLNGSLTGVLETEAGSGERALLLTGYFYYFDDRQVNNIIRVTLD
ncbi:DUF5008 domain-containing protein [Anseongella ginsenosidimutans]|nr:DUF5008 domain-containing protein [Anseongella ginsenosidimutans]